MKAILILIILLCFSFLHTVNWQAKISIETDNSADLTNYFGKNEAACTGHDNLDICDFPGDPWSPFVLLYFPHPDWGDWAGNFSKDMRSDSLQSETWQIETKANPANNQNYTLSWQNIEYIPLYYDVNLILHGLSYNMRSSSGLTFTSDLTYNTFVIKLTPNNYPPTVTEEIGTVIITENLTYIIDQIPSYFFDVDSLSFSTTNSLHIETEFIDNVQLRIIPETSWFGLETIILHATDLYFTADMKISIQVLPSKPSIVTSISVSYSDELFQLDWDPVTVDVNNHPIGNILYKIYKLDPITMLPIEIIGTTSNTSFEIITTSDSKMFFYITAVNGEENKDFKMVKMMENGYSLK